MNPNNLVSLRAIRRVFDQQFKGDVSRDTLKLVQTEVNNYCCEICDSVVKAVDEINYDRKQTNTPPIRRIQPTLVISLIQRSLIGPERFLPGEVAQYSSDTTLSEANEGV